MEGIPILNKLFLISVLILSAASLTGCNTLPNYPAFFMSSQDLIDQAASIDGEKNQIKLIRFGDPKMTIKKDQPARRKSFRARHKCDTSPPDKLSARYWSCKKW